jgi:hypothetical protein
MHIATLDTHMCGGAALQQQQDPPQSVAVMHMPPAVDVAEEVALEVGPVDDEAPVPDEVALEVGPVVDVALEVGPALTHMPLKHANPGAQSAAATQVVLHEVGSAHT